MQSFFSETLTVLRLTECQNVPLTLFLVCPNLREVYLDQVKVLEFRDDEYRNKQCFGRESPALEHLTCYNSGGLVRQMVTPPPRFPIVVVDWSRLRVLKLCPEPLEKEDMLYLQLILDAACNTLEELCVYQRGQLNLAGLVDLRHLPNLRNFTFHTFVECDEHPEPVVSRDINFILSTIPNANQLNQLVFCFKIYGNPPYGGFLEQDLVGMCDEVVRVSAGKRLELILELILFDQVNPGPLVQVGPHSGGVELYESIKEKISHLSGYPNISTHLRHSLVSLF